MLRALYSAATGMEALQINIDNIAHNIANVNTTGFKQRRTQFQDLVAQNWLLPAALRPRQKSPRVCRLD